MKAPWSFARFLPLAERLLNRGKLPALIFAVVRKSQGTAGRFSELKANVRLLQALCLAYWRGEYRAINPRSLVMIVAGLLYFVSPIDAIPDWIPGIGLLDDIAVLAWVVNSLEKELAAFKAWRDSLRPEKLRVVERLPASPRALQLEHNSGEKPTM
ncbi:YkvA family protein [Pseudomonas sp. App30]|uniref:YkvA family protein n=1 Tax=Pseudomonas sp. App30 TaxID=3068990 RepID=UPI003A80692A